MEEKLGIKTCKKIRYLGIWLTVRCSTIKQDNYNKLLQQTKIELEKWEKLNLSLMGKIAAVKMNIFPKFIFLFQTIPIYLNQNFFKELNKLIREFIWQKKKARIKWKLQCEIKERGGLGLPPL